MKCLDDVFPSGMNELISSLSSVIFEESKRILDL